MKPNTIEQQKFITANQPIDSQLQRIETPE